MKIRDHSRYSWTPWNHKTISANNTNLHEWPGDSSSLSEAEERLIEEKLRGLGYL